MPPVYTLDNGANAYLNEAQNLICEAFPWLLSKREHIGTLASGALVYNVPDLRKVEEVWIDDGADCYPLHPRTQEVIERWHAQPLAGVTPAMPYDWALLVKGSLPTFETPTGQDLLVMPPSDAAYTFHVRGWFVPAPLVNNTDTNLLTERYRSALVHTAWACYLRAQGNVEGFQAEWNLVRSNELYEASRDHFEKVAVAYQDQDGLLEIS